MKKIAIVGAFDRYNYGDILFPIIIKHYLEQEKYANPIINFSLLKKDLTNIGGVKTTELKELYISDEDFYVIIAGGDILSVDIGSLYIDLSSNMMAMYLKKGIRKFFGKRFFNYISKKVLKINSDFPWIINENSLKNKKSQVVYNAVGGTGIKFLDDKYRKKILRNIYHSDYISVRENYSKSFFNDSVVVSPDSAVLMSEYFNVNKLEQLISENVRDFVKCNNDYICFQINYKIFSTLNEDVLIEQLNKILKDNKKILLLPIGFAKNHDDLIALRKIKKMVNSKDIYLIQELNIFDITYLIAKSSFFIGTSLHGNIIAMSYAIPHLGLSKKIIKLDSFIKTWEKNCFKECISEHEIYDKYCENKNIEKNKLKNNASRLKELAKNNFNRMFENLKNGKR